MTTCIKCHRPLKHATASGMGRVCESKSRPVPVPVYRDLFGYDVEKAAQAAGARVQVHIESLAADAHAAVRRGFREARVRLGVWAR